MPPQVTVLMTVYNGLPYLGKAIDSILAQTYTDFEFLIIDDASTDASCALIESYSDARIRLIRNEHNLGQVASLNGGLRLARGDYIARLDQDDWSLPTRLASQVALLDSAPRVAVVGTWLQVVHWDGQTRAVWKGQIDGYTDFLFSLLQHSTPLYHPSVMFRKRAVLQVDGYDVNSPYAEDFSLWVSLALARYNAWIIAEPLCCYRLHQGQQSVTKKKVQRQSSIRAQERLIEVFSNGFPARTMRLFFENDDSLWQEVSSPRTMQELVQALQHLLEGMRGTLDMSPEESSKLEQLFYRHTGQVAYRGISQSYRKSLPLFLFALREGPRVARSRYLRLYPLLYLSPSPILALRMSRALKRRFL